MIDNAAREDAFRALEVETESQELASPKMRYLNSLALHRLIANAKGISDQMTDLRSDVNNFRLRLNKAREIAAKAEAALMLTEAFASLKNDAARKGWLLSQRGEDLNWCQALVVIEHFEGEATLAEASHEARARDWQLILEEIRLAEATLRFLAG